MKWNVKFLEIDFAESMFVVVRTKKFMRDCIVPTVKYDGGSITLWEYFENEELSDLVKIYRIRRKEQYH